MPLDVSNCVTSERFAERRANGIGGGGDVDIERPRAIAVEDDVDLGRQLLERTRDVRRARRGLQCGQHFAGVRFGFVVERFDQKIDRLLISTAASGRRNGDDVGARSRRRSHDAEPVRPILRRLLAVHRRNTWSCPAEPTLSEPPNDCCDGTRGSRHGLHVGLLRYFGAEFADGRVGDRERRAGGMAGLSSRPRRGRPTA